MQQGNSFRRSHRSLIHQKPGYRISKSPPRAPRRSVRLQEIVSEQALKNLTEHHHQLPSPSSIASQKQPLTQKRKRLLSNDPCLDEQTPLKRPRASSKPHSQVAEYPHNPVAHWVLTTRWPKDFGRTELGMSQENSSKRKSTSLHHSDRLRRLAENGVYMRASALIQKPSKDLCRSFLTGDRIPGQYPCYPPDQIPNVLERIQSLNEGRLQRDITPWLVPSAENLGFSGQAVPDYIGEEIQADWIRCATMGSTRPKPDYTAGLLRKAFTKDEIEKLQNYASFERPFFFTPNLCYPFLICEAKTGEVGMDKANRQNIHSASIAVKAIIDLYKAAFGTNNPDRVNELYGQVLAFSVSHNNMQVNLYGHYAVPSDDSSGMPNFYRYDIAIFGLTMNDGAERFKAYNFVLNVYEKFVPNFRKMIKTAVACLPLPAKRTGLSFAASDLASEEIDYQSNSQSAALQDEDFQTPTEPASVSQRKELVKTREQMEWERKESRKREERLLQQVEQQRHENEERLLQQRHESEEREERMKRESEEREERMKRESEEREERMKRESEEREERMKRESKEREERIERQMMEMMEMISLLKQAAK